MPLISNGSETRSTEAGGVMGSSQVSLNCPETVDNVFDQTSRIERT